MYRFVRATLSVSIFATFSVAGYYAYAQSWSSWLGSEGIDGAYQAETNGVMKLDLSKPNDKIFISGKCDNTEAQKRAVIMADLYKKDVDSGNNEGCDNGPKDLPPCYYMDFKKVSDVTVMTMDEAQQFENYLSKHPTFNGSDSSLHWKDPNGCKDRSQEAAKVALKGYPGHPKPVIAGKAFVIGPILSGYGTDGRPNGIAYHVAIFVRVSNPAPGEPDVTVIDPFLSSKPISLDQWVGTVAGGRAPFPRVKLRPGLQDMPFDH